MLGVATALLTLQNIAIKPIQRMQMTTNGKQRKSQILGPAANGKTETARIRKKKNNIIKKCQAASGTGTGKTQMLPHGLLDTGPAFEDTPPTRVG